MGEHHELKEPLTKAEPPITMEFGPFGKDVRGRWCIGQPPNSFLVERFSYSESINDPPHPLLEPSPLMETLMRLAAMTWHWGASQSGEDA